MMCHTQTGRGDKLILQFRRLITFITLNDSGYVKHQIDIDVPPFYAFLPIRIVVSVVISLAVTSVDSLHALVLFRGKTHKLEFSSESRHKPLTYTDIELRSQTCKQVADSTIAPKSINTGISREKPVVKEQIGDYLLVV